MRYLSRNKVYQKVEANRDAKKIYIFCEGEDTEIRYFKYFQGLSSNIDIIPVPSVNGKSDPLKLKENANLLFFGSDIASPRFTLSAEYKDEVWFAIDTDRWNEGDKINQLKSYCIEKSQKASNQWLVAQSNPCFELWFYFHFNAAKPDINVVNLHASFKEFINSVIKGGFDCRSMPIEIEAAIQNSKNNFTLVSGQPSLYSTEIHFLGETIIPFIKDQIAKAKKMFTEHDQANA